MNEWEKRMEDWRRQGFLKEKEMDRIDRLAKEKAIADANISNGTKIPPLENEVIKNYVNNLNEVWEKDLKPFLKNNPTQHKSVKFYIMKQNEFSSQYKDSGTSWVFKKGWKEIKPVDSHHKYFTKVEGFIPNKGITVDGFLRERNYIKGHISCNVIDMVGNDPELMEEAAKLMGWESKY